MTKRTLVTVSHAIERAAAAASDDAPMVVFAMFQRAAYFERERRMYGRIAAHADAVVIGAVDAGAATAPAGAVLVPLTAADELAREWSVVVLTPRFGAALVAYDLEQVDAGAATLEAGRLFDGTWHFRRDEALHEAIRLRRALTAALPQATLTAIDGVVDRARYLPSTAGEQRAEASMRLFADRLERHQRAAAPPAGAPAGPEQEELGDDSALRDWTGESGVTASGTLPLALIGIRMLHTSDLPARLGRQTTTIAMLQVVRAVTAVLRPVDRAVRLPGDDLLLVLPSMTHDDAIALAYRLQADIAALHDRHGFVPDTTSVVLVTRQRPLPLERIRDGLSWSAAHGVPVATLGDAEPGTGLATGPETLPSPLPTR